MIRIDENTYIDDTLVTCAEYQLFIDEMREWRKFYQPDHWTSYLFPVGQARAPIVGVRFSDAKAFCEWLNEHEAHEWLFRLPTSIEAEQYPITTSSQSPQGYWAVGTNGEPQFTWVGLIPINLLAITLDIDRVRELDHARYLARGFNPGFAITLDRDLERNRIYNLERSLDVIRYLARGFDPALDSPRSPASYLDRVLDRAHNLVYDRTRAHNLDIARTIARDLSIDLFSLQERIAGRSPAFEGIRLVKERVK